MMTLLQPIRQMLRGAVDELFPLSRGGPGDPAAEAWQPDAPSAWCPRCGASAGPGAATERGCTFCLRTPVAWHGITRLSAYAPPMDGWIKAMKFSGHWKIAPHFGRLLAEQLHTAPLDEAASIVVVPVPMHWSRRWRRGYNQAALMAEALAVRRGWPMVELLRRRRHTPPQPSVAPSQRSANVRHAMAVEPVDLSGHVVVLVDDVRTSGATLSVCTRLLQQAGAAYVHAAVAAVADPHGADFKVL